MAQIFDRSANTLSRVTIFGESAGSWSVNTLTGVLTLNEATDRAMRQHYRGFVSEPRRRAGFASALAAIVVFRLVLK